MNYFPAPLILTLLVCSTAFRVEAQYNEHRFGMFYTAPVLMNPAFAGASPGGNRLSVNYNQQDVSEGLRNAQVSYDQYSKILSGGIAVNTSYEETGYRNNSLIAVSYAPRISLNNGWSLQAGVKLACGIQSVDFPELGMPVFFTADSFLKYYNPNHKYLNGETGILLFKKDRYIGFSLRNLARPDYSLLKDSKGHSGLYYSLQAGRDFSLVKSSDPWRNLDLFAHMYVTYENRSGDLGIDIAACFLLNTLVVGVIKHTDYIGFLTGYKNKRIALSYSRSVLSFSKINAYSYEATNELSFLWYFNIPSPQ